jgi:quercetin dioxygenase-like cupin family protein
MIKLPKGFDGVLESTGNEFRSVVIQGEVSHKAEHEGVKSLLPGSYIESDAPSVHHFKNSSDSDVTLYVRTNAPLSIK